MLRRSTIPSKRNKPRRKGTPTPRIKPERREDLAHLRRVRALPCLACEIKGLQQTTPTEAHHIRRMEDGSFYGKSEKAHDDEAIPLCYEHHWNGVGSVFTHRGFEAEFGNERDLLAMTLEKLKGTVAA